LRASSYASPVLIAGLVLAGGASGSAHRYDEFLQAARIGLESDRVRVEMSLTPGIAVADAVVRDIDVDGDGVLSSTERQAYAERVLKQLTLRVDGSTPLRLALADSDFPDPLAMRNGEAAITLRLEADMRRLDGGAHRLSFRNDHATSNGAYLANALIPDSPQLTITRQQRDFEQRELNVDFTLRGAERSVGGWTWIGVACALLLAATLTRRAEGRFGRARLTSS
jgi:hypothetical protein